MKPRKKKKPQGLEISSIRNPKSEIRNQRKRRPLPGREMASLSLAHQLTKQASQVGFDWPDIRGVLDKLDEELNEFREALSLKDKKRIREELGDLLFVMANIARFLRIDPETALRRTIKKFISRFRYVEATLREQGKSFKESNLFEMDRLWEEAKRKKIQ